MITSTAANNLKVLIAALLCLATAPTARAGAYLSPWLPLYQGVDYATGTNTPSATASMPDLQVMRCVRVDLTDPDVRFITNPRISNFSLDKAEVAGTTVSNFLAKNKVQIAINANYFYQASAPFGSPDYNLPQGTPFVVSGLLMSQGQVVVPQEGSPNYNTTLVFSSNNVPTVTFTNWPVQGTNGAYTAVTGTYPILVNGFNIGTNYLNSGSILNGVNPRTAFGVSQDSRHLYLMVIDGRQSGYSDGAPRLGDGHLVADGRSLPGNEYGWRRFLHACPRGHHRSPHPHEQIQRRGLGWKRTNGRQHVRRLRQSGSRLLQQRLGQPR